jgi:hypothetical protein
VGVIRPHRAAEIWGRQNGDFEQKKKALDKFQIIGLNTRKLNK